MGFRPVALVCLVLGLVGCGGPSSQRAEIVKSPSPAAREALGLDIRPVARTYVVDPAHSRFEIFGTDILGGQHRMRFKSWRARVSLDPTPHLSVHVDTASVVVDMKGATRIVRRDVLEVDRFPAATLDASLARSGGSAQRDEHVVEGMADLHGVKRRLRFVGRLAEQGDGYRFRTEFLLSRKEFAIHYAPIEAFLKDDVRIVVDAFARPAVDEAERTAPLVPEPIQEEAPTEVPSGVAPPAVP